MPIPIIRRHLAWTTVLAVCCLAALPLAAQQPRVAAVELHNQTDIFLPRVGSYSEEALVAHFSRFSDLQILDRTIVSDRLLQRYDRVVLFPSDPQLTADFGRDLGVDYVITGNIVDYETDTAAHRMMVEFRIIDVAHQDYILRKVYDGEVAAAPSEHKKHREILDQIIEHMALDFEDGLGRGSDQEHLEQGSEPAGF